MISKLKDTSEITERLDYEKESGYLYWKKGGKVSGWTDPHGYRLTRIAGRLLRNHHIVWFLETGEWPTSEIDHINNDPSDNKFSNLRLADRKQQGANQKLQVRRKGKFKGVHQSGSGNYYVKVKKNKKTLTGTGTFTCEKEAALKYNYLAEELFGEFAHFNQVFKDIPQDVLDKES